ncbi:MAG: ShlB/FhaC/HecB family hemolysin secretion/activation protein [Blastomonas sp.]
MGIGSILGFGAAALPVQAQVNVPSPPTREEVDRPVPRAEERGPRLEVEGDIERSPCPLRDPSYAGVRLTLNQVTFNNLKGATADEMRAAYAPYLGTEQQVGVLCDIRDAAATMLRRKGYLAAVQVPTQRIENGNVQLEVLYAKITAIRVRGDAGRGEQLVAKYLERLTEDEVFNQNNAERYLLLARDLPGYDVRLTLVPAGTGPGELVGDVAVRRTPYEVDFNVQNLASDDAGHFGGQLRAQFYGLTGMGDRTTLAAYSTLDFQEQQVVQIGHEMRLGSEGLRIGGRFTYAWTKPDIGNFGTTSIKADTLLASLEASYPLLRSQAASVWISGGLELVNQDVDFIGPLSRDRLRIGYVRVLGEAVDLDHGARPRWRMNGTIEFRQGLDILGASDPCNLTCGLTGTPTSRPDGDPTSSVLRAAGEFEVALGSKFSLVARPRAQIAFGPVLSFEEFSGGNYTVGRGFDPGTIVGDDGVGISLELRGPRIRPFENTEFAFQPFVFFDNGWAFDDTRAGAADPQRLTSLGGGFRSRFQDRFQLDVTLAVPTNRAGFLASTPDPRLLFTFTTLLLPWGDR